MSPKKEKLLQQAYDAYIDLMLRDFPLDRMEDIVAPDISGYGTTLDEKILNIERLRKLVNDQRDQGAGIDIRYTSAPVCRRIGEVEDSAIFVDEFEITMMVDGNMNMIPLRLSSVFEYHSGDWKLVHLHGSKAVETEGDTWHKDELKKKNEELQKLVDQKTRDIEQKKRDLEIEAALERVRSVTMGMQNPDDLMDVCQIISEQLELLNVQNIRNTQVAIIGESKKIYSNYQFFTAYSKRVFEETGYENNPASLAMVREMQKSANSFFIGSIKNMALKEFREWRKNDNQFPDPLLDKTSELFYYFYSIGKGGLGLTTYQEISDKSLEIFKRFHNVFALAYRRFIDIQQAEAQAREARIEAALERVRSRSMAMHHTSELQDVINTVYQQFNSLDMAITGGAFIAINEENRKEINCWGAGGTADYVERVHLTYFDRPIYSGLIEGIKKGPGFFTEDFSHDEKIEFFNHLFQHPPYSDAPPKRKKEILAREGGYTRSCAVSKHTSVFIINHHGRKFSDEENNILVRFGKVFEQTYTRFLDLKKAEEQAREAQVELSLERIRAQVTAMSESAELLDIVVTMRKEFVSLGHEAHYFWYMRYLPGTYEKAMTSGDGTRIGMVMTLPRHIHGDIKLLADWEKSGEPTVVFPMDVETAVDYVHKMITLGDFKQVDPSAPTLDDIRHIGGLTFVMARTTYGEIGFSLPGTVPDPPKEDLDTLVRFAVVFDLAYRRFEDLKTAEQQNRETQIELALERVRAKTMAMQKSEELAGVVTNLFGQLDELGIKTYRCNLAIVDPETERCQLWSTTNEGKVIPVGPYVPLTENDILRKMYIGWKKQGDPVIIKITGDDRLAWTSYISKFVSFAEYKSGNISKEKIRSEAAIFNNFSFKQGFFTIHTVTDLEPEARKIIQRFANVFEQTYTRFLDLKKAEGQAREAQVEAALERVRAKSMAMHKSEQLPETAKVLFEQFESLGDVPDRMTIGIFKEDKMEIELWATDQLGTQLNHRFTGSLKESTSIVQIYNAWKEGKDSIVIDLSGQDLKKWIRYIREDMKMKLDDSNMKGRRVQQAAFFSQGIILYTSNEPVSDDIMHLLVRFAKVFDQAYVRFLDLQKAEAQARNAIKQASLDRVRGQIASMRTAEDLQRITPLIWQELETFEVPFIRCGVFLVDETKQIVNVYLTTPDGRPLGALHLPFGANNLTINTVDHWKRKKVYTEHWDRKKFMDWMESMVELGQVSTEEYQGGAPPPDSLDLHFIPFAQGMLYVGNVEPLDKEKIGLVTALAEAFAIAYARYEDFKNLEEAKNKVEATLRDLKSAQAQLIHSEKMASLGELTAGIAHEIQNPLNFVNNFSEVSVDLLDEMHEEMDMGKSEEVKAIAEDLKQNLEKIRHHGQRASGIVKGMLEHSRSGNGEKQPTDINALADEYLRLAYHGLRAKDKSFNADFSTDLDEQMPLVKVIPQDIGRVILNLINNAFYASSAKASAKADHSFKPMVVVTTKKLQDKIEIRVKDNGPGIPGKLLDKIFQPFFTTKPTGIGTGLGLSLSYDIITKGHGGDLKVNTQEGQGTEFIVSLPAHS